jgi:hypothetical protein
MLFLQIKQRMRHRAKSSKIKYEHQYDKRIERIFGKGIRAT